MASLLCLLSDRAEKEIKPTIKKKLCEKKFSSNVSINYPFQLHELQMSSNLLFQGRPRKADYNHPSERLILLCVMIRVASIVF